MNLKVFCDQFVTISAFQETGPKLSTNNLIYNNIIKIKELLKCLI